MNKGELIKFIAKTNNIPQTQAEEALNMVLQNITKALTENDEIMLAGFGAFLTKLVPAREGRNPQTGNKMTIPSKIQVKFKPYKELKDSCNTKMKKRP